MSVGGVGSGGDSETTSGVAAKAGGVVTASSAPGSDISASGSGGESFLQGVSNGLSSIARTALNAGVGMLTGMSPEYGMLLSVQLEAQREMQLVSMVSNIHRSRHEAEMAAIRNLRLS